MAVELRVHGIGNHRAVDALGSPRKEDPRAVVDVVEPPRRPDHPLCLAVWSRTVRGLIGQLWYLAVPYTLINTVANMAPKKHPRRAAFQVVTVLAGWLLTIAATTWTFAVAEAVIAGQPGTVDWRAPMFLMAIIAAAVVITMLFRGHRRMEGAWARRVAWLHAVTVVGYVTVLWVVRPATVEVPRGSILPTACTPIARCSAANNFDLITTVTAVSSAAALVLCFVLFLLGGHDSTTRHRSAAGAGAAFGTAMAFILVHVTGALGVFGVSVLLRYFDRFWWKLAGTGTPTCVGPPFEAECILPADQRVLLVVEQRGQIFLPTVLSLYALLALAVLATSFLVAVALTRPVVPEGQRKSGTWRAMNKTHQVVVGLPRLMPSALGAALLVYLALAVWLWVELEPVEASVRNYSIYFLILQIGGALIVFLFPFGYLVPTIRTVIGKVADVLGFWPVEWHPLGGLSYRDAVVKDLEAKVGALVSERGSLALVGHSQGSVVCAWMADRCELPREQREQLHLVTCGSPLSSLYGTFFPSCFDADFFTRARANVATWDNFWRPTDPIATHLPVPCEDRNQPAATATAAYDIANKEVPDDDTHVWAHSNYWTDRLMMGRICKRLTCPPSPTRAEETPDERVSQPA